MLAINVQLASSQGGQDGHCIFIDSEGSLTRQRLDQMLKRYQDQYDTTQFLKHIHVFRVLDHIELVILLRQLPSIIRDLTKVKLLILDSVAHPFGIHIHQNKLRYSLMNFTGQTLLKLSSQFNLKCVVTNHLTKPRMSDTWRPALGPTWTQWCHHRIVLCRRRHQRFAYHFSENDSMALDIAPFSITATGIGKADDETMRLLAQAVKRHQHIPTMDSSTDDRTQAASNQNLDDPEFEDDEDDLWNQPNLIAMLSEIPSDTQIAQDSKQPIQYTLVPDSQPLDEDAKPLLQELQQANDQIVSMIQKRAQSDHDTDDNDNDVPCKRPHFQLEEVWGSDDEQDEQWLSQLIEASSSSF
ncbi:P-loop containing nucleoside triphosphate hydrolase protein [Hesseltinella vesiculosa]|uniref:DNA repair protein RAD51 homolog 3 n=1 Tax=Hesseltinella vesiculosa TaxID=101127 RepID=A0A1X2G8K9_9FUNG|nr:P-loop containing nucleoside triphosphate hydrolase protein [Hesseltinella vesiculosa]